MRFLLSLLRLLFPERETERVVRETEFLPLYERDLGRVHVLLSYGDSRVRAAILEAKFHRNQRAIALLGAVLHTHIGEEPVIGIPVPLSARRLKERGYNQVEMVAREAGLEVRTVLTRVRDTAPQTKLSGMERRKNMEGAFAASAVPPAPYLLLDDVTTTGATLEAASHALKEAGINDFRVVALAH